MTETKTRAGGLVLHVTDQGDGAVFERFFAGYDRAFVLPDEKEDVEGFRSCLALNHGAEHERLTAEYGPFREVCLVAEDEAGASVGGANLIAALADVAGLGKVVTSNLNYVYVDAESRGQGHLRRLVAAVAEIAGSMFGAPGEPIMFIEQNDPFRMSAEAYSHDTEATGLDQLDRLRIWSRLGARIVDFDYVQPALSAGQAADDSLIYAVLGRRRVPLPACLLAAHLRRFFGISVLKGAPIAADATAAAQLGGLDAMCAANAGIALLDPGPLLELLPDLDHAAGLFASPPASMRAALQSHAGPRGPI